MTVVAIRCEACEGVGLVESWADFRDTDALRIPEVVSCPVCNGTGTETPPQDHDKDARRAIEGKADE